MTTTRTDLKTAAAEALRAHLMADTAYVNRRTPENWEALKAAAARRRDTAAAYRTAEAAYRMTDAELAAAYEAGCAKEVRTGQMDSPEVTALVAEIHRRWDLGTGPHLSI